MRFACFFCVIEFARLFKLTNPVEIRRSGVVHCAPAVANLGCSRRLVTLSGLLVGIASSASVMSPQPAHRQQHLRTCVPLSFRISRGNAGSSRTSLSRLASSSVSERLSSGAAQRRRFAHNTHWIGWPVAALLSPFYQVGCAVIVLKKAARNAADTVSPACTHPIMSAFVAKSKFFRFSMTMAPKRVPCTKHSPRHIGPSARATTGNRSSIQKKMPEIERFWSVSPPPFFAFSTQLLHVFTAMQLPPVLTCEQQVLKAIEAAWRRLLLMERGSTREKSS